MIKISGVWIILFSLLIGTSFILLHLGHFIEYPASVLDK